MTSPPSFQMQFLSDACADGDLDRLRSLLKDPDLSAEALKEIDNPKRGSPKQILNLKHLIQTAARSNQAALVSHLVNFAREHSVPNDAIVNRETLYAALSTQKPKVMAIFVGVKPSCVNMLIGYSEDPLLRAITGPYRAFPDDTNPEARIPLVKYLLEQGADPNQHMCGFLKPGGHLYTAVYRQKPLEMVRLLLEHGAQIEGTGAFVAAAERGRIDVMEMLLAHGADVNKPRTEGIFRDRNKMHEKQRAQERPIDAARREGQEEAVRWLESHGAVNVEIRKA